MFVSVAIVPRQRKVDGEKIIKQFDHHPGILKNDGESGEKRSLDSVGVISDDPGLAHLVITFCHSVRGPGGSIDDHEHKMIVRIADALGISPDPEEVTREVANKIQ